MVDGTVPSNKELVDETILSNKELVDWTDPSNSLILKLYNPHQHQSKMNFVQLNERAQETIG